MTFHSRLSSSNGRALPMYNKEITVRGENNGYLYFIDKDHPLKVGNSGLVYLHRHVASIKLGRWLSPGEEVHHIDFNKRNNDASNLEVLSNKEHIAIHTKYNIIGCKLCGIEFKQQYATHNFCSHKCADTFNIRNKSITKELLNELIPQHSWVSLGKIFGYSDNGIKKRAIALGCDIPKRKNKKPSN